MDSYFSPQTIIYLAGAFYVLGLVIVNQLILRLMILFGTGLYLLYYWTVSDTPLWEAIYISALIGVANVVGIMLLIARKSRLAIPSEHADIYDLFPDLPPGDFRALMKLAKRYVLTEPRRITTENAPGTKLYFVIKGTTVAEKGGHRFMLPPKIFVGEVAYSIGQNSSASTWLEPGAEVLEWSFDALQRKCARNARFKLALDASISQDLARKVAAAVAPNRPELRETPPQPRAVYKA